MKPGPATPRGHRNANADWPFPFPAPGRWSGKKKLPANTERRQPRPPQSVGYRTWRVYRQLIAKNPWPGQSGGLVGSPSLVFVVLATRSANC